MSVVEIIQAIAEYGVYPVLMAVLLFLIIRESRLNKKNKKDMSEQNKKQEEKLSKLITAVVNAQKPDEHTKEEEEDNRRVNNFIESQLNLLIAEEKANRAYVFLYHNGGKDMTGRGFQKMSITNEVVDVNTVSIMSSYQNVPRSLFPTLFKTLVSQDVYYVVNVEDIREMDPMTYQMFTTRGVQTALIHAMKRTDGLVVGFVAMEYAVNKCADVSKAEKNLERIALKINGALINKEED